MPKSKRVSQPDAATMADIESSILILLGDAKDHPAEEAPYTIDSLTETMAASGYPTERAWVVTALNNLVVKGKVRGVVSGDIVELV